MRLALQRADRLRDLLERDTQVRIRNFYQQAANEANVLIEHHAARMNISGELQASNYTALERQLRAVYDDIQTDSGYRETIMNSMTAASRGVTGEFSAWLQSNGFPPGTYMTNVPTTVVNSILTGKVYKVPDNLMYKTNAWGLSKSIWGNNEKIMKDVHTIIAKGIALDKGVFAIAKDLEWYVDPDRRRQKLYPGTRQSVDANAERLVRTLINHAYQQTFKDIGEKNPFIEYYVWNSAFEHGRTCQVCMDMDGNKYAKDGQERPELGILGEMPLDHPNGLCYFTYEIDTIRMVDELSEWVLDPESKPDVQEYIDYLRQ